MKHSDILKRSWRILWSYRALWLFGFFIALTSGTWLTYGYTLDNESLQPDTKVIVVDISPADRERFEELFGFYPPENLNVTVADFVEGEDLPELVGAVLTVVLVGLAVALFLYLVGLVFRYVSETALIRMVNEYENEGRQFRAREGLRIGFSRDALRLFAIDVIIRLPVILLGLAMLALALLPLLLWTTGDTGAGIAGTFVTGGLLLLLGLMTLVASAILSLVVRLAYRACIVEGMGVFAAIGRSWTMLRGHLADVGAMWILMLLIDIFWPIVVIPVAIVLTVFAAIGAAVIGVIVWALSQLAVSAMSAIIIAGAAALVILIALIALPLAALGAFREVYQSSAWTLTYRELRYLEKPVRKAELGLAT